MGTPGYETDPVDREFDRLLTDVSRAGSRHAGAAFLSDGVFESLLTEFKSLNVSDAAGEARARSGRENVPASRVGGAAGRVAQAWQQLAPHLPESADPSFRQALRRMHGAMIGLQLAQHAGSPHEVLAMNVAGQPFALAPGQVVEVLDLAQVCVEREGARASAMVGTERVPLHFARRWLAQDETDPAIAGDAWVVMAIPGAHRIGFVVDGVEGVLPAARQAPGGLLRGARGVVAVAVAGQRLLPLLDLTALLEGETSKG